MIATHAIVLALPLAFAAPDGVPVDLDVVKPSTDKRTLRWSPKGMKAKFKEDTPKAATRMHREVGPLIDPVFGEIKLGPGTLDPIPFALTRINADSPYRERLILDADRDGHFDPKREVFDTTARDNRGRMWVSHSPIIITIDFAGERAEQGERVQHEFNFWHVYPKPEEEGEFDIIRFSRSSWMEGEVSLHGIDFRLAIIDADNDGVYSNRDRWSIVLEGDDAHAGIASSSGSVKLNEPCFVDQQAYRLDDFTPSGRLAHVRPSSDVKPEPEQPTEPARPKADEPLTWLSDYDAALAAARDQDRPLFIKWTADWCGPCHTMDRNAYQDQAVVKILREGYICLKLDRDLEYRLAGKLRIRALPTMQIFAPDGTESDRHVGMLTSAAMETWLREQESTR